MKQKELFNLAVRILGLVFLYFALQAIPFVAGQFWVALLTLLNRQTPPIGGMLGTLVLLGWQLLLAIWLIGGAPFLMRKAYPPGKPEA